MVLVEQAINPCASPPNFQVEPRVEDRRDPSRSAHRHFAHVAAFNEGDQILRAASGLGEIELTPTAAPPKSANDPADTLIVHAPIMGGPSYQRLSSGGAQSSR